jgi:16S rRNA (uracil1498-N3)-methyltransferase
MNIFYDSNISGEFHVLNETESNHCVKVLRLKIGDEIFLTDGKGNLYKSNIIELHQKKTLLKISETYAEYNKRPYYLHIAIAPTKNTDRFEWFLEKAVEIGIDEITPIICKNSERKIIKSDRLNRIAEAAMKQSYKAYHPQINEQISFEKFIKNSDSQFQKFIAHCEDDENKKYLGNLVNKNSSVLILIGPEGDFSKSEIQLAKGNKFTPISLGMSRLRTETAGIVACDVVSILNQL